EVDLVVLDPADREGELHLQRPHVRGDLIRGTQVDAVEPLQDLVPLVHVALVQAVVRLDRSPRDAVELEEGRLQLPGSDLFELVDEGHEAPCVEGRRRRITSAQRTKGAKRWGMRCLPRPTRTTRSSRTSTSRRCGSTTTSIIRRTSTRRTARS